MTRTTRKAVIIDDESRILDIVRLLLSKLGFEVHCAGDGETGLALTLREKPDLLVTDMLLPKLHGLEICKTVRSTLFLSHTRIVAMTAIYKRLKFRLEAKDVRVDAYVEKPFDVMEFTKVIRELFSPELADADLELHVAGVQEKIDKEAESFVENLPETLEKILSLWRLYQLDQENPGDLEELHQLVHRVTGAAALYRFHEVSRICRKVERILTDIKENGGAIIDSQQVEITHLLDMLPVAAGYQRKEDTSELQTQSLKGSEPEISLKKGEIPVTIISMAPEKLEELVKGIGYYGYRGIPVRFGDLGRKTFSIESSAVIVDLRKRPSGNSWIKKLDVCMGDVPLNVVAVGDEPDSGTSREENCWKWIRPPMEVWAVVQKLEEGWKDVVLESPLRLLVVMQELAMAEHYQILLRQKGFLVASGESYRLFSLIREFQPDLVLLDFQKPIQKTLQQVRTVSVWNRNVPVIVKAGPLSSDEMASLEKGGVCSVISDGESFDRLAYCLRSHGKCWRQFRQCGIYKFSTGVLHYAPFMAAMETELKWASKSGNSMSVAVFGIDNILELSRKIGEWQLDRLSIGLCRLIQGYMADRDCIGKVGGTVFAGFFTSCDGQALQRLLSGLQHRFASLSFFCNGIKINTTFSAGISRFPNLTDRSYLFEAALNALVRGQKAGNNKIILTF